MSEMEIYNRCVFLERKSKEEGLTELEVKFLKKNYSLFCEIHDVLMGEVQEIYDYLVQYGAFEGKVGDNWKENKEFSSVKLSKLTSLYEECLKDNKVTVLSHWKQMKEVL